MTKTCEHGHLARSCELCRHENIAHRVKSLLGAAIKVDQQATRSRLNATSTLQQVMELVRSALEELS
jgi:hypothetical protein